MQEVGKYQLIRKLATGGMAEVFLAKAAGPMGFEKTLVLKRILPHLAEEPAFVEMFLSEAKLAARLTHPNIVQIFDFGQADGAYFLAMEYIDGPSLRTLIQCASAEGLSLPLAVCARLIAHACEGLAFAHDFTDPETGEPLSLVHRDISPDNILLSRQGAVKVVDFGIAKAAGQRHKTESGVIKGKLAYMPPEQVRAEPLDRRVDVYALGVVLYELLTCHKPFEAGSDVGLMRAILTQSPMPAVQFRPELPDDLRRILGRALCKDREQRYPDCHAFQLDLEEFILSVGKPVTTQQIAQLIAQVAPSIERSMTPAPQPGPPPGAPNPSDTPAHTLASPDAKTDVEPSSEPGTVRLRRPEVAKTDVEPSPEPGTVKMRRPEAAKAEAHEIRTEHPTIPDTLPQPRATHPSGRVVAARIQRTPVTPRRAGRGILMSLVAVMLLVAGGGVVLWRTGSSSSEAQTPVPTETSSVPTLPPTLESAVDGPGARLQQHDEGGSTASQEAAVVPGGAPSEPTELPSVSVSPQPNEEALVAPNSVPREPDTSGDKPLSAEGGLKRTPRPAKVSRTPDVRKGAIEFRVRPYATIFLSGKKLGDTPVPPVELLPGHYTVKLVNTSMAKTVVRSVEVKPGQTTVVGVNLSKE